MHFVQVEWKSTQASLFIILLLVDSLSNTILEHQQNAQLPNTSDFKLGKSIHYYHLSFPLFNSNEA